MKNQITIPRAWLEKLVEMANYIREAPDIESIGSRVDSLLGYIDSAKHILELEDKK